MQYTIDNETGFTPINLKIKIESAEELVTFLSALGMRISSTDMIAGYSEKYIKPHLLYELWNELDNVAIDRNLRRTEIE